MRRQKIGSILLIAYGVLALALAPRASGLPTYDTIDYVVAQDPLRFSRLWQAAETSTVRLALLGDSQETSPLGAGGVYVPRLNYELWRHFGNMPETPLAIHDFTAPVTAPLPADWLLRVRSGIPGPEQLTGIGGMKLPSVTPVLHSTRNSETNVNGQDRGTLVMLQHDSTDVTAGAQLPSHVNFLDPDGVIRARVFGGTRPDSGGLAYVAHPTDSSNPRYRFEATTSGTLDMDLEGTAFTVVAADTAPLDYDGKRYMALEVFGTDDDKLSIFVGLRFYNESDPRGMVISDFSQGGYTILNTLTWHARSDEMFAAQEFHAAILHYGANDVERGASASTFLFRTRTLIDHIRRWADDPAFPIILMGDPYRTGLTAWEQSQFDQYAGAQLTIAESDPNVMMINSRRMMEDIGWSADGSPGAYLDHSGVHYRPDAARALAEAEIRAMLSVIDAAVPEPHTGCTVLLATLLAAAVTWRRRPGTDRAGRNIARRAPRR